MAFQTHTDHFKFLLKANNFGTWFHDRGIVGEYFCLSCPFYGGWNMNLSDSDFWSHLGQDIWNAISNWLIEVRIGEDSQHVPQTFNFLTHRVPANLLIIPTCPNDDGGRGEVSNHHKSGKIQENEGSLRFSQMTEFEEKDKKKKKSHGWSWDREE